MALKSDISIDTSKFDPAAISEQTLTFNQHLLDIFEGVPKWYEVGAQKYRKMRLNGETPIPPPKPLPQALDTSIPSRDSGRTIPCRLIYPSSRKTPGERRHCKGTLLHIHGGGWVLGDHVSSDKLLLLYADTADLAVLSVGYRLAPENRFPKGPEDCIDVGEYLVQNSEGEYGGPLRFIGGESAGAHLSVLLTYHLLHTYPSLPHPLPALLLHYGIYDLSLLPSARTTTPPLPTPLLTHTSMRHFISSFLPASTSLSLPDTKNPSISPFYADWAQYRTRLPLALFTVGTVDPLLDDGIAMAIKWAAGGGEAVLKVYEGAAHGFLGFGLGGGRGDGDGMEGLEVAEKAVEDTRAFMKECMAQV